MKTAIVAIIVFATLVLFHELGHFAIAKLVGIKVNEFSIGMGPKLLQWKKKDTEYTIRALPIGGFVSMEGEEETSDDPEAFDNATPLQRIGVIAAGPVMNLIIAFLLLWIVASLMGSPTTTIGEFSEISPAREAGVRIGDVVKNIDGTEIVKWEDIPAAVTANGQDGKLLLTVERDGQPMAFEMAPTVQEDRALIGITPMYEKNLVGSFSAAWKEFSRLSGLMLGFFRNLFGGKINTSDVSGPIGIITVIGEAARSGVIDVLLLGAFLSINLAFVNLLPIPALDGSKILLYVVEMLRGRPLDKQKESTITVIGFAFLMIIMLLVSLQDLSRLFF
jgi:regulator of sigma E protease